MSRRLVTDREIRTSRGRFRERRQILNIYLGNDEIHNRVHERDTFLTGSFRDCFFETGRGEGTFRVQIYWYPNVGRVF